MKKTEKIEIRVSQSEKEALTQLAQVENRSVSEMLRELARKYVLLNKGSTRLQYLRPKAVFALALCFFMGGVVFTQTPRAMAPLPYHISGSTGDTLFGSKVSEFGHSEIATENHIIAIQYLKSWNTDPKMKIEVFQKVGFLCYSLICLFISDSDQLTPS